MGMRPDEADDFSDIEYFILVWTAAGSSIDLMRPPFPRWRRQLRENGVKRVTVFDALASNLMIGFIHAAMPKSAQNRSAMHEHRNLLYAQGAPMLSDRGWKP